MSATERYWRECIDSALEDAGVEATAEQRETMADVVAGAVENFDQAFYQPSGRSQQDDRIDQLTRELAAEKAMVLCGKCNGSGTNVSYGGTFQFTSTCMRCNGRGRHAP